MSYIREVLASGWGRLFIWLYLLPVIATVCVRIAYQHFGCAGVFPDVPTTCQGLTDASAALIGAADLFAAWYVLLGAVPFFVILITAFVSVFKKRRVRKQMQARATQPQGGIMYFDESGR